MAKRKTSRRGKPSSAEAVRQIERIDRDLVKLFNERAKLAQQAAAATGGESVYDAAAEWSAIQKAVEQNRGPLPERTIRGVMRELVSGTRSLVTPLRVAYLGPQFSYSHLAAIERFGEGTDLAPVATIAAVFDEVHRRQVEFGLVPIENSTDGRVIDTLDSFARVPVKICGEVKLAIHHNLLGKCPREQIREVYSKPQALSQCRQWLARHLPAARTVEMTSTAAAAQLAADRDGAAAVASLEAASRYGLDVIAANIEDNRNNVTRFAVIAAAESERTGNDKTAIMFEIPHQPGALADAMNIFKRNRLNLTWIESFPMPGTQSEYLFFVEMEGHPRDARLRRAMTSLEKKTVRLEVLGSYPKSEPLE